MDGEDMAVVEVTSCKSSVVNLRWLQTERSTVVLMRRSIIFDKVMTLGELPVTSSRPKLEESLRFPNL